MDTKLAQVTQAVIDALQEGKAMDAFIDSTDAHPEPHATAMEDDGSPAAHTFTMRKDIDRQVPGRIGQRFPSYSEPVGHIVYTVTVTGKYVPFDDE